MSSAKRLVPVFVLALVVFALTVSLASPILRRQLVESLAFVLWLGQILLLAVPQAVWWILLIVIGSYVAIRTLSRGTRWQRERHYAPLAHPGPVQTWARHIAWASEGDYFRERLTRELGRVIVAVLAQTRRAPAEQIRRELVGGELDVLQGVPPDIIKLIASETRGRRSSSWRRRVSWLRRLFVRPKPTPDIGPTLEQVIRFLERETEVEIGDEAA